MHSQNKAILCD